ncbi:MAG: MBL fold metallo-hydrolase [Candidatus Paralactobacillus gallistercoris]|uniref:MBL fold metallo-hydrolase n=1 Tax=Candidatus Paralactobacillus gallistercoris TaxID=2838724 RepID=A0A948TIL0_9LACO|nr:MBL fold metallo-hydrolase [Candidatus Paralactobacillus gallistercoris]
MNDFGMRVSILASSSSGNVTFVETPQHKLLIDAGLSGKKIEQALAKINRRMQDVDMLLVTHEHTDHSHSVGILARRYPQLQIYANQPTWDAMHDTVGQIDNAQKHVFAMGTTLSFGDLDVESFGVSHDAAAPQFYQLHHDDKSFAILTDTGYVSQRVEGIIKDANAYLLECNHDLEMLRMGSYPWTLKQRILSDTGHLSNEDSAQTMIDILGRHTKRIYLGHLSHENNMKSLARLTVTSLLKEAGLGVGDDFKLYDTDPQEPDALFTVE